MTHQINKLPINTVFSFVVILAFFSFGTFRFFNLFNLSMILKQAILISLLIGFSSILQNLYRVKNVSVFLMTLAFFFYTSILGFFNLSYGKFLVLNSLFLILSLFIISVDFKRIVIISKGIVNIAYAFALMGIIVSVIYTIKPSLLNLSSIQLASSETGSNGVNAITFLDYLSLPSWGNLNLYFFELQRVKSFSNEPSSAIVHFLPPIILSLFLNDKFKFRGGVILIFLLFFVSSLICIIIFILAFLFYFIFRLNSKGTALLSFIVMLSGLLLFMLNMESVIENLSFYGKLLNFDLMENKATSATERLSSYRESMDILLQNPFGGSNYSTMTGLWLIVGKFGGFPLIFMYLLFSIYLVSLSFDCFSTTNNYKTRFSCSLIASLTLIVFTVTSYGWYEAPGVISFFLIYRVLKSQKNKEFIVNS
tara:strand:- start:4141 stop:5409 length:1269 start_codon:yes stop_codon:yes gene_type:complete